MIINQSYKLNNNVEIPKLGFGTWMLDNEVVVNAVLDAFEVGYRHIDTAQAYENEEGVGIAIKKSGISRNELFITSKIAAEIKSFDDAYASILKTLEVMDLDYIDLMIIHSPQPWQEWRNTSRSYDKENLEVYRALEKAHKEGLVKSIGVSNFLKSDLKNILDNCIVKPVVNQILGHVSNTPFELMGYCNENEVLVEAYSPIGHGEMLKNEVVIEMAKKYDVSVAQLCIRYLIELGTLPLPKTQTKSRMIENVTIDFEISNDDMQVLNNMDTINDYGEFSFFPVFSGNNN